MTSSNRVSRISYALLKGDLATAQIWNFELPSLLNTPEKLLHTLRTGMAQFTACRVHQPLTSKYLWNLNAMNLVGPLFCGVQARFMRQSVSGTALLWAILVLGIEQIGSVVMGVSSSSQGWFKILQQVPDLGFILAPLQLTLFRFIYFYLFIFIYIFVIPF